MLLPRAAVALAAALALAGCGTGADRASDEPTLTIPTSVGASTPAPTTSAAPSTPATSSTPTPTPTAASSAAPGKILDFNGIHLLLPVEQGDLPGIPDGLRTALAAGLKKRWDAYGDAPGCQKGPVYVINKVDTAGWASIDAWDDPSVDGPKCSGVGGGYTGFWADVNGTWQEVIGTQELPACTKFEQYHFPTAIVGDACAGPDGGEVPYRG